MRLEPGSTLGHYEVTALIGEGGMGQVYQATDTKLNRQVALKILPEACATDPDRLARFQREAQVLASLNDPSVRALYRIEEAAGERPRARRGRERIVSRPRASFRRSNYRANGSGRSWKWTILLLVPRPPSVCQT